MQLQTDHIGFPLLFIEELGMWTNLIPITKVQFEYYLCDRDANRSLDNAWYSERLKQNPRVTARRLSMNDYHQCFMTSLLPQEADYFANWA
ncbi:MAG: hypothetical protein KDA83_21695, partial [Planctomycetales bacterium]|nr:hypothetical protein [Planctomycetales bacterium]